LSPLAKGGSKERRTHASLHTRRRRSIMSPVSIPRFYVARLEPPAVDLPEAEARHARQSRRLSAGDVVALFDGRGRQATGRIATGQSRAVTITLDAITEIPRPRPALTLAFAVPKGPRQDVLIEKCTELGVAVLQPITTARSIAAASGHRLDKWHRTAVEAAKQSGQTWLPELRELRTLQEVLRDRKPQDIVLLGVSAGNTSGDNEGPGDQDRSSSCPRGSVQPRPIADLLAELRGADRVLALVGPEGGWTDEEIAEALAAAACPVSLGPNVLRIETAAVAVAAIIHGLLGI
jgi:16S rRNA (uracil1498-N3)-methyltransferase